MIPQAIRVKEFAYLFFGRLGFEMFMFTFLGGYLSVFTLRLCISCDLVLVCPLHQCWRPYRWFIKSFIAGSSALTGAVAWSSLPLNDILSSILEGSSSMSTS